MLLTQIRRALGLPDRAIQAIARKASHAYKTYLIPKRAGGFREVHHPSKQLKALQRWLLQNIIWRWPVHTAASAYRANRSIANNAEAHVKSGYLLRMDFQDFFPSISSKDVTTYLECSEFCTKEEWTAEDIQLFVALVC